MSMPFTRCRTLLLTSAALLAAAPASAQEPNAPEAVRAAIDSLTVGFEAAFAAGDAAAVAAYYTEDAIVLPPGSPPVVGRAAIQELWGGFFAMGKHTLDLVTSTLETLGDVAVETGSGTIRMGDEMVDVLNYLVVYRREGGVWRLHRDTWNSQREAAHPAPAPQP